MLVFRIWLNTFRDSGGLWEGYDPLDIATVGALYSNPNGVRFLQLKKAQLNDCLPNLSHLAISNFQNNFSGHVFLTQNVDDLHERAEVLRFSICTVL